MSRVKVFLVWGLASVVAVYGRGKEGKVLIFVCCVVVIMAFVLGDGCDGGGSTAAASAALLPMLVVLLVAYFFGFAVALATYAASFVVPAV